MFPNLRLLHLQNNPIQYLPSWILFLESLVHICGNTMFCHNSGPARPVVESVPWPPNSTSQPGIDQPKASPRWSKLGDLVAGKIREYLDLGGDWTVIEDTLPPHLVERISSCPPLKAETQALQLKETNQIFVVEKIPEGSLARSPWRVSPITYVEGLADPQHLPLYIPRKK
jgi:hypothetical protein